jgi:hypothetical protein
MESHGMLWKIPYESIFIRCGSSMDFGASQLLAQRWVT